MSSRTQQKARARKAREARQHAADAAERRRRRLWQLGGAALLALAVVAVAIAISQSGSDRGAGSAEELAAEASAVEELFGGIRQDGVALGDPGARATLIEFADLQCPFCAQYSREVLPTVIERYVRTGRLRLVLHPLTFIGQDSVRGARVAAAASQQDRLWQFVEVFYRAQGTENTGYVTDDFLAGLASATPGLDSERALAQADSPAAERLLAEAKSAAEQAGVDSTPSFLFAPQGEPPRRLEVSALTPDAFTSALDEALGER